MHEQSIVESLLAVALENAERAQAGRILKINLVVGELSGVLEEAANFYFSFLSRGTIASQATLVFRNVPAQLRCRKCERVFALEGSLLRCPDCHEQEVEIVSGRELFVESLEVE
jgi:hydrogenase nickel incorporation protein HypA/HybF